MPSFINYCNSIVAPTSSSLAFNSSASALETFSFNVFGAPSTNSLASFNPNPKAFFTAVITLIF